MPAVPEPSVVAPGRSLDVQTLEALHRITDAALAHLTEEELLQELLQRIAEIMEIDTVAILLLEGDELRARAARGIEEEVEQGVRVPLGRGFAGRIAAERRPITLPDVDHADVHNPLLRAKGIRSLLGVPLLIEGRVIGVLHVGSLTPRVFTADDTALLQLAGDRAALAIEHGRVFAREREARHAAELATRRLQALQRVTDAALAYLPEEDLLQELLQRISDIMEIDTVAILLLEGDQLHARAAKGIEEEVEQGVRVPLGRGFAGRVAAQRRAIFLPDTAKADIYNPLLRAKGIRSLLGVPLLIEGRVIGVLHVGSLTPRVFTADDTALLQLAADRAALAIEQARLYEQRRLAEALQRRLLGTGRHDVPGLEVSGRYLPAAGESLGGDWYDAFPVPDGRIALAVGDVVGHGIGAAAVMAQLRTALRAYAIAGHAPAEVVARVDHLMATLGPNAMTTLAYVVLDPVEQTLEVVNAGHPPPLVVHPSGETELLLAGEAGGAPLGALLTPVHRSQRHPFPDGTTVLLYTDGLVERRGESLDVGLERLRTAAAGACDVERLCTSMVEQLVPEAPADDVAFIAARLPPLGERLDERWPARPDSLADVRRMLRRWLAAHGAGDDEAYDIVVATGEACANAIEHAYGPGVATFVLEAAFDDGRVRIAVRDEGRWREPRGVDRGRGLPLMEALMDEVDVRRGDAGTEVVLTRRLGSS
jgi:GAF domain-containing protein/anti-sigma regulatory factor (Ser/Thr protein kinase)